MTGLAQWDSINGRQEATSEGRQNDAAAVRQERNVDLTLGPDQLLTCERLEAAARREAPRAQLSEAACTAVCESEAALQTARDAGVAIYGLTTGFGPFVRYAAADRGGERHGAGLLAHLAAGVGPDAPDVVVRGAMLLRVQALAQGFSGIRLRTLEAYLGLLASDCVPVTPEIGSVGASGDLIPLSYMARALTGEGEVRLQGVTVSALEALTRCGLTPCALDGRDALALTNGTSFLTAYAALAVARAERLIARAEALTGWAYRLLGCRAAALDPRLHRARGHAGQCQSSRAIREEAYREGDWEDVARPLQEIYSLRCAPQTLGACRENLSFARRLIETEMNGVNDNPLTFPAAAGSEELPAVLHGGNFFSQQVAFAADALNAALTQAGLLADRQLDALLDPRINGGAPLLLAQEPGADSGMAGAQITATALAAEMRTHTQAYSVATIPTNGGNQDIVPMGTLAAREALAQTERLAAILAIVGIALAQLRRRRLQGLAPGAVGTLPSWMPAYTPFDADRPLRRDIDRIAQHWLCTVCPMPQ